MSKPKANTLTVKVGEKGQIVIPKKPATYLMIIPRHLIILVMKTRHSDTPKCARK